MCTEVFLIFVPFLLIFLIAASPNSSSQVKKSKDIKEEDLDAKLDLEYFSEIASDPITRIGKFC